MDWESYDPIHYKFLESCYKPQLTSQLVSEHHDSLRPPLPLSMIWMLSEWGRSANSKYHCSSSKTPRHERVCLRHPFIAWHFSILNSCITWTFPGHASFREKALGQVFSFHVFPKYYKKTIWVEHVSNCHFYHLVYEYVIAVHCFRDYLTLSQSIWEAFLTNSAWCLLLLALPWRWSGSARYNQESRIHASCMRHTVMCYISYMCHSHTHFALWNAFCRQLCAFKIAKMSFPLQPFKARVNLCRAFWIPWSLESHPIWIVSFLCVCLCRLPCLIIINILIMFNLVFNCREASDAGAADSFHRLEVKVIGQIWNMARSSNAKSLLHSQCFSRSINCHKSRKEPNPSLASYTWGGAYYLLMLTVPPADAGPPSRCPE